MDFIHDTTRHGKAFKPPILINEFTRERRSLDFGRSITSNRVVANQHSPRHLLGVLPIKDHTYRNVVISGIVPQHQPLERITVSAVGLENQLEVLRIIVFGFSERVVRENPHDMVHRVILRKGRTYHALGNVPIESVTKPGECAAKNEKVQVGTSSVATLGPSTLDNPLVSSNRPNL